MLFWSLAELDRCMSGAVALGSFGVILSGVAGLFVSLYVVLVGIFRLETCPDGIYLQLEL